MFFFKQKTAYEMRISDWSSDVCSSDLRPARPNRSPTSDERPAAEREKRQKEGAGGERDRQAEHDLDELAGAAAAVAEGERQAGDDNDHHRDDLGDRSLDGLERSEEHTSELQSLMRISYAVFCLKKKKHTDIRVNEATRCNKPQI